MPYFYTSSLQDVSGLAEKIENILRNDLPEVYAKRYTPMPDDGYGIGRQMLLVLTHYESLLGIPTEEQGREVMMPNSEFNAIYFELLKRNDPAFVKRELYDYMREIVPEYEKRYPKGPGTRENLREEFRKRLSHLVKRTGFVDRGELPYDCPPGQIPVQIDDVTLYDLLPESWLMKSRLRSMVNHKGYELMKWLAGEGGLFLRREPVFSKKKDYLSVRQIYDP